MRPSTSQPVTVSLPMSLLVAVDAAAHRLGATRSELFRAALRQHLRQLERDDAMLRRVRSVRRADSEAELAERALATKPRARRAKSA